MLPLSGALQLKTSADQGSRPIASASGARLVLAQARQAHVPQPFRSRQGLEVFQEGRVLALPRAAMPGAVVREHEALDECIELPQAGNGGGGWFEVH
jgi:hypothetical protein